MVIEYITILVVMEVLFAQLLVLDICEGLVSGNKGELNMSIVLNFGHVVLVYQRRKVYYYKRYLRRLHFQFMHCM